MGAVGVGPPPGVLTWAAQRLLGSDALVAGGAESGGRDAQGGEEVAAAGARLPLSRLLLALSQALLLLVLQQTGNH